MLVGAVVLFGGCGGAGGKDDARITVFAAASLTDAVGDLAGRLDDLDVTSSFAGSQAVVQQVLQGGPADVVATADERTMRQLVDAGRVERPRVFAHNALVIAVEPGNPAGVDELADLARPDLAVVLAQPSVPAGRYAADALAAAGVTVRARSLELDVRAALAKVVNGEADAAVVYASDVRATGSKAEAVPIQGVSATYEVAVVRDSGHRRAAGAFVAALLGPPGRAVLRDRGFGLP